MQKQIFIAFLVISTLSLQSRSNHHSIQSHNPGIISSQCCSQRGGTECGRFDVDCCYGKVTCKEEGSWFTTYSCPDQDQIWKTCPNSCIDQCQNQGGKICSKNFDGTFVCCADEVGACTVNTFSSNTCKTGKIISINLSACVAPSYAELIAS